MSEHNPRIIRNPTPDPYYVPVTLGLIGTGALAGRYAFKKPPNALRYGPGPWVGAALGAFAAYTLFETSWWWK